MTTTINVDLNRAEAAAVESLAVSQSDHGVTVDEWVTAAVLSAIRLHTRLPAKFPQETMSLASMPPEVRGSTAL